MALPPTDANEPLPTVAERFLPVSMESTPHEQVRIQVHDTGMGTHSVHGDSPERGGTFALKLPYLPAQETA